MAVNPSSNYGVDVRCVSDIDVLRTHIRGLAVIVQDAFHRLTTDNVAGPNGVGWGKDCRAFIGMPSDELAAQQPLVVEALLRDDRILTVDVALTATTTRGLDDVAIEVDAVTDLGPFRFVLSVADLTIEIFEGSPV